MKIMINNLRTYLCISVVIGSRQQQQFNIGFVELGTSGIHWSLQPSLPLQLYYIILTLSYEIGRPLSYGKLFPFWSLPFYRLPLNRCNTVIICFSRFSNEPFCFSVTLCVTSVHLSSMKTLPLSHDVVILSSVGGCRTYVLLCHM